MADGDPGSLFNFNFKVKTLGCHPNWFFKFNVKTVGLLPTPAQKGRRRGPSGHPAPFHEASVAAQVTMAVFQGPQRQP